MGDLAQSRLALVFGRWHMLTHLSLWEFARRLIKCRLPVFLKSEERLSCGFSTGFRTDVSLQGSWDTIFDNVSFSFLPIFFLKSGWCQFYQKKNKQVPTFFFCNSSFNWAFSVFLWPHIFFLPRVFFFFLERSSCMFCGSAVYCTDLWETLEQMFAETIARSCRSRRAGSVDCRSSVLWQDARCICIYVRLYCY